MKNEAILAILVNDEVSTDAELATHFEKEFKLTSEEAQKYVSERSVYLGKCFLSEKVTRCKCCGCEIGNVIGWPLETICTDCADVLE